jgi:hypothetical protein
MSDRSQARSLPTLIARVPQKRHYNPGAVCRQKEVLCPGPNPDRKRVTKYEEPAADAGPARTVIRLAERREDQ